MTDPLRLAEVHLNLLYVTDMAGYMIGSRDPNEPTPYVHLVRTTAGNRWYIACFLPPRLRAPVEYTLVAEPVVPDVDALESTPPTLTGLQEMLTRDETTPQLYRGPVFAFEDTMPAYDGPAKLLDDPSTATTVPELARLRSATPDIDHPIAVIRNEAGEVVSICLSVRTAGTAAEAGIETAPAYRGRGYAVETTRLWAATVRANGGTPVYSTQWSNTASRAVARKLGLVLVGEDVSLR